MVVGKKVQLLFLQRRKGNAAMPVVCNNFLHFLFTGLSVGFKIR